MRFVRPALVCVVVAGCLTPKEPRIATHAPPPATPVVADAAAPPVAPPEDIVSYAYGKRTRKDPNDLCEPVDENLKRAEKAILSDPRRAAVAPSPWDPRKPPRYMDIIDRRYALTTTEKNLLKKNGFVVPARLSLRGYADALHDIYQSQLPIYISSDAILHAVYKGNDAVLAAAERDLLLELEHSLETMHSALGKAGYPAEVRDDLDVYLTVARTLLAGPDRSEVIVSAKMEEAKPLIERALAGTGGLARTELFGRARMIDWSQYTPRGHYAGDADLERWFRAAMWLSRLELNLVSRASRSSQPGFVRNPEETPREAVLALALADLAERAGELDHLDRVEKVWSEFAGKREDVSIRALLALKKQAGITTLSVPDSAEKLKAAIGSGYQRTARLHYMPEGSTPLPAIATMFGPRVVPDSQVQTYLVHSAVPDRPMPSFADVAFMLGHDRPLTWLAEDFARFPNLEAQLAKGRAQINGFQPTDVYSAWLGSIRAIATPFEGERPSFMRTKAYEDMKVNTTVAAYGQLRHNFVLVAGQAYDEGGCEIPDGYIEPALPLYESLVTYAQRGAAAMKAIDAPLQADYFTRLEKTLDVIVAITKDELAGRPLSDDEKRWLSMTSEIVPPSSDGPGSYDGWYFGMFPSVHDAFAEHAFVADWFTSSNASAVVYAGAKEPRLGLFVVDTGGEPRIMVGPVARAFEHVGSLDGRLTDKDASKVGTLREPWAASYTAAEPPAPPLQVLSVYMGGDNTRSFAVRSNRFIGKVTIELLGHHRDVVGKKAVNVGPNWTTVSVQQEEGEWASMVRVRYGEGTYPLSAPFGYSNDSFGGMPAIGWEQADEVRRKLENQAEK